MRTSVNDDDARDLTAAIAGDHQAFARIYDRHAAVVLSLCRIRAASAGDGSSAEDACQETFLRAFRLLPKVNGAVSGGEGSGLRSWLYAIARRVCSEARRSTTRRHAHEGQAMMVMLAHQRLRLIDSSRESERYGIEQERLGRLTEALAQLDERERLAIHLHYLEADPERAAREALNLSRSGYYKVLSRARDKLATLLADHVASP
jgi:RNA polymerase sigma-70 factor, ECF subfamily